MNKEYLHLCASMYDEIISQTLIWEQIDDKWKTQIAVRKYSQDGDLTGKIGMDDRGQGHRGNSYGERQEPGK